MRRFRNRCVDWGKKRVVFGKKRAGIIGGNLEYLRIC
jgi:hypothetical protein